MTTWNNRVGREMAAEYAGVSIDTMVNAITGLEVRAITLDRRGDWIVPLPDLDGWWRCRTLARAVSE